MQLARAAPLFLICVLAGQPSVDTVSLDIRRVPVPPGDVLGAAFLRSGNQFIVQEIVEREDPTGMFSFHRFLSLWSVATMSRLAARDFGLDPPNMGERGGRIVGVEGRGWLIICSSRTTLEILNSATLATERVIVVGRYIYDFAVDESRDRIYVVSYGGGSSRIASYLLSDGSLVGEATVALDRVLGFKLAVESKSGQVIVADTYEKRYWHSRIYLCSSTPALSCSFVSEVDPINQMDLLGRQLLFIGGDPAVTNSKRDCIKGLNLDTKAITKEYCSEQTGVRYATGVAAGQFVVGYTGITKHLIWDEMLVLQKSSIGVWKTENRHVVATLTDPSDKGDPRHYIVASRAKPVFLLYNSSNVALFAISENR